MFAKFSIFPASFTFFTFCRSYPDCIFVLYVFNEFSGEGADFEMKGYRIHEFRVRHNVPCYGYAVSVPRLGAFDVEKARQNQVPLRLWNRLQHGGSVQEEDRLFTPEMVMGADRQGLPDGDASVR